MQGSLKQISIFWSIKCIVWFGNIMTPGGKCSLPTLICFDKTLMQRGESDATAEECLGRGRPLFGPVSFPSLGPSWCFSWMAEHRWFGCRKNFLYFGMLLGFPKILLQKSRGIRWTNFFCNFLRWFSKPQVEQLGFFTDLVAFRCQWKLFKIHGDIQSTRGNPGGH